MAVRGRNPLDEEHLPEPRQRIGEGALALEPPHLGVEDLRALGIVRRDVLRLVEQSVVNGIDCLTFENNRGGIEKVYFDISRRFEVGYPILAEK